MQKWQYEIKEIYVNKGFLGISNTPSLGCDFNGNFMGIVDYLNMMGRQGWELVSAVVSEQYHGNIVSKHESVNHYLYLKKPIEK
jgi:hypothetical protein